MRIIRLFFRIFILLPFFLCHSLHAEEGLKNESKSSDATSGIALNRNQFFRFNNAFQISFDLSLQKGYEQYLEYLVHVVDLNKRTIDVILSSQSQTESEIIIISENYLSKKLLKLGKSDFGQKPIHFDFDFDLQMDKLTLKVGDTVFVDNRLGLKPHNDYRIVLGSGKEGINHTSALQITNVKTTPDLSEESKSKSSGNSTLYWVLLIIVLDVIVFGYFLWRRWKRKQQRLLVNPEEEYEGADLVYQLEKNTQQNVTEITQSAVYLFKEFQVFDQGGKDISKKFTPLLKELFLLLLLYTQKEAKGISTVLLKDLLWYDKGTQSASNNRAVNIGKLKNILDGVGEYEIITAPLNIQIELSKDIYCDYIEVFQLLREKTLNKEQIIQIVEKAGRGPFLPECNYEWLDNFKAEISEAIIDNLLGFTELVDVKKEAKLIIQISDTIFNFDNLNETALSLKCRALIFLGRHSLASATYTRFVKEYETLYQTPYKLTFSEISHSKE